MTGDDRAAFKARIAALLDQHPELRAQFERDVSAAAAVKALRERLAACDAEIARLRERCAERGRLISALIAEHPVELGRFAQMARDAAAPDPETPLSDALHTLGQVRRMAESMAASGEWQERQCGRRILAALGEAGGEGLAP